MSNPWYWWEEALKGNFLPRTERPEQGYYRVREHRNGPFVPVIIWYTASGEIKGRKAGRELDDLETSEAWLYCCKHPVTVESYEHYMTEGRWPEEWQDTSTAAPGAPPIGHNLPPAKGSIDALKALLEPLITGAKALMTVGQAQTQLQADQAADLANMLTKIAKTDLESALRGDPEISEEQWAGYQHVADRRQQWHQVIRQADIYKSLKRIVILPWLSAAKAEQNETRALAVKTGGPVPEKKPITAGAGAARKISAKTQKVAAIQDYEVALHYFRDNFYIKDQVQRLANAHIRSTGLPPPGCTIAEKELAS